MGLKRFTGVALWRQIEQALTEDMQRSILPQGARLSSELDLARRFGVNRHTVRRAIAEMAEKGLLRVRQGQGTFVQERVIDYPVSGRTRFSEILTNQQRDAGGELIRALEVSAERPVAQPLGIRAGSPVILLEVLGKADNRPISLATHYFPKKRFAGLIDVYRSEGTITRSFARFGIQDYARRLTRVTARMPDTEEASLLRQPRNRPILVTESINVDGDGHPIEFGISRFAGDRVQLVVESG